MCISTRKGTNMDCKNYRTIALIPHASKIVLSIIRQRMMRHYQQVLSETQAGFMKDNGTRDQIVNMRLIFLLLLLVQCRAAFYAAYSHSGGQARKNKLEVRAKL